MQDQISSNNEIINNKSNESISNFSNKKKLRSENLQIDFSQFNFKPTKTGNKTLSCNFCRNNGEPEHIYMSHSFKNIRGVVTCPILASYKCEYCGESGSGAHTITYCKLYKESKRNRLLSN